MFTKGKKEIQLIAEVKIFSPFNNAAEKHGKPATSPEPEWDALFDIANAHGDIVSVHTDVRWKGSMELIQKARTKTERPILAKGIHATDDLIRQAHAAGADLILVVGRVPNFHNGMLKKCLIEPTSIKNMKDIIDECSRRGLEPRIVWNSRDLETGKLKTDTDQNENWIEARKIHRGWMCQASNIKTIKDVHKDADAVLVGENLEKFVVSLGLPV